MRRALVLALLLSTATCRAGAISVDGTMRTLLADLYEKGGFGRLHTERAAFLVGGDSETVECLLWPRGAGFQRATYRGSVPANLIAIAHTHPNAQPLPSAVDHELADRIGVPVLVVTRRGVLAAMPGNPKAVEVHHGDMPRLASQRGCMPHGR